ncbi:hypothetical protein [Streptomyces apocyni]|uniref:hypothetical protein n=1 Tax=Streptomyces apocyni TaxID=2654677 RepID=UPI0012E9E255|nr:hypothetical protein [Streptomyces apocyni]
MSITAQFALDSYRAAQHGEPQLPAPGSYDRGLLEELRDAPRVPVRKPHGRLLTRLLRGRVA